MPLPSHPAHLRWNRSSVLGAAADRHRDGTCHHDDSSTPEDFPARAIREVDPVQGNHLDEREPAQADDQVPDRRCQLEVFLIVVIRSGHQIDDPEDDDRGERRASDQAAERLDATEAVDEHVPAEEDGGHDYGRNRDRRGREDEFRNPVHD